MLSKITRNFNVLNGQKDLIKMKSIKNFPVFMTSLRKILKEIKDLI